MFTFLKGEYGARVIAEYRARLFAVRARLLLLLSVILLGGIFPLYASLQSERDAAVMEREAFSKKMVDAGQAEVEDQVKELGEMAKILSEGLQDAPLSSVLADVFPLSAGVSISSVQLEKKKDHWLVTLAGKADTRDALVLFSKNLESVPALSHIDLPVSSLAKNRDISFSINLRHKL